MNSSPLPFARPSINQDDIDAVVAVLESGWLTQGPVTREFEERFAETVGAKHAIAVCSCTAALHLALEAVGVGPGDTVLTTPYTFTATAEVIRYLGAEIRFTDIEGPSMLWDVDGVAQAIAEDPKVKALLPVHVAGQAVDMEGLLQVAEGRPIVEDAAHALPTDVFVDGAWKRIGSVGTVSCFSFYATKTITSAEGGMVTTDDDELAARMRVMRLHGIDVDAWRRYREKGAWGYDVVAPGFKYNISDLHAALGNSQLQRAETFSAQRTAIAQRYNEALADLSWIELPTCVSHSSHCWHLYATKVRPGTIDRQQVIHALAEAGIGISVHFKPLHLHSYYAQRYNLKPSDFPVALDQFERAFSLPIFMDMSHADVDRVIAVLRGISC
ncbi:MAG: DegT/DnrJ/EryC1/StrS aminotransferase family protein [Myxococcota bacterium]|nr:DegT/DnrJ/EryC1/StrS aminotransferase family protein [Myxococcota bacterium]